MKNTPPKSKMTEVSYEFYELCNFSERFVYIIMNIYHAIKEHSNQMEEICSVLVELKGQWLLNLQVQETAEEAEWRGLQK